MIYLLYNGSHYDVFMTKTKEGRETGVFDITDKKSKSEVLAIAHAICKKIKSTDIKIFRIKCNDCNSVFQTDNEALIHLKNSGHSNFHQIKNEST